MTDLLLILLFAATLLAGDRVIRFLGSFISRHVVKLQGPDDADEEEDEDEKNRGRDEE